MRKRACALACLVCMICLLLTACGGTGPSSSSTADYTHAIVSARSDTDNETEIIAAKQGNPPAYTNNPAGLAQDTASAAAEMTLSTLGIEEKWLEEYAFSISLINVRAYAVGIFKPAAQQADSVRKALQDYIHNTQKAFEQYLPEQYEIARQAQLKTLSGGEIVLVMCENASSILKALEQSL